MTTKMVRKQIYIQSRQEALLKRLAQARGLSEAELYPPGNRTRAWRTTGPGCLSRPQRLAGAQRFCGSAPVGWAGCAALPLESRRDLRRARRPPAA
jgi:hypothetical protein